MVSFNKPLGDMAIWITFKQKYSLTDLSKKLASHSIYMNDGSRYNREGNAPNSLMIGFASMNEKEMKYFIDVLSKFR